MLVQKYILDGGKTAPGTPQKTKQKKYKILGRTDSAIPKLQFD